MKQFPDSRCVAISYNRLLLNDTSLRAHQHRMKLSDIQNDMYDVCDCEQGIELNRVQACLVGVRRGVFTCVGWKVTLCDPIMASDSTPSLCMGYVPLTAI